VTAKTKPDPAKQKAIDKAWRLYNNAIEATDELMWAIDELKSEHDIEGTDRASDAAYRAHSALEEPYSTGAPILPTHTNDMED